MTARLTSRAAAAVAATCLVLGVGVASASAAPAPVQASVATAQPLAAKTYANCTALKKVYKGGVAKSKTTKNKVSGKAKHGIRSNTKVSAALYKQNSKLDRDKDGWACE